MDRTNIIITFLLLLLQSQLTQTQINNTQPGSEPGPTTHDYSTATRPKEVIIVAVVSTFLFISFYFIYLCFCIDNEQSPTGLTRWTGWRPWNPTGSSRHSLKNPPGLDPNIVMNFPKFEYRDIKSTMTGKGKLECTVCLVDFQDTDTLRLVPKCHHVFHCDCVDKWLICNATCPVCRLNVSNIEVWDGYASDLGDTLEGVGNNEDVMTRRLLSRSLSTGHVAVKQWERMDRFRLPLEVSKQLIKGESSSRRLGGAKVGSERVKSESWVFYLGSGFLKASFRRQVYKGEGVTGSSRVGLVGASFRALRGSVSREGSWFGGVRGDQLV